jgi:hypothetical protein
MFGPYRTARRDFPPEPSEPDLILAVFRCASAWSDFAPHGPCRTAYAQGVAAWEWIMHGRSFWRSCSAIHLPDLHGLAGCAPVARSGTAHGIDRPSQLCSDRPSDGRLRTSRPTCRYSRHHARPISPSDQPLRKDSITHAQTAVGLGCLGLGFWDLARPASRALRTPVVRHATIKAVAALGFGSSLRYPARVATIVRQEASRCPLPTVAPRVRGGGRSIFRVTGRRNPLPVSFRS